MIDAIAILFLIFCVLIPGYAVRIIAERRHRGPKSSDDRFLEAARIKKDFE